MRYICIVKCLHTLDTDDSDLTYRCTTEKNPTLNVHVQPVLKDIVLPETVIHDTVPSHEGVQEGCSSNPMPSLPNLHGYQYLKSLFYGDRFAGSTNHAFSCNESGIYDLYAEGPSPLGPLLDSHSTLIMNYISGDQAVCLYPVTTLLKIGIRLQTHDGAIKAFAKYRRRGFIVRPQLHGDACQFV